MARLTEVLHAGEAGTYRIEGSASQQAYGRNQQLCTVDSLCETSPPITQNRGVGDRHLLRFDLLE